MYTFVCLYRGPSIAEAKLVAVSGDHDLIADVSARLLRKPSTREDDSVTGALERGRRAALRVIHKEAKGAPAT